jgi:hypothetical protein
MGSWSGWYMEGRRGRSHREGLGKRRIPDWAMSREGRFVEENNS